MAAATDSRAVQRGAAGGWGGALPFKLAQAAPPQLQPGWPPSGAAAGAGVQYSVLANQTAIHGLPAAISQVGRLWWDISTCCGGISAHAVVGYQHMLWWDISTCLCWLSMLRGSLLPAAHAIACRTHKHTPIHRQLPP